MSQDDIWVDVFDNVDEVVALFEEKQVEIRKKMIEIENQIAELENEDERAVLLLRYMENLSFQDISKRLPISERTVYRKHSTALNHLKFFGN